MVPADDIDIQPFFKEVIIFSGKSPLRRRVLCHIIGQVTDTRPQLFRSFNLRFLSLRLECKQISGNMAVSAWVLVKILLVVFLRSKEVAEREKLYRQL